ncbi:hypothetical protein MTBBW1_510018 [Desulfamplus magnetovallimortis]|uniref:Uncharacterized protein n=1 Tax=Desulfamplus magnetovallimortis TaxID=1246637 RepID=A0A1W1HHQ7_9BACT|nr:hypothetical protein MTBBW1_510018 [Desulfamplus magnetovallimortis]
MNLGNPDSDSVDKAYKIIGVDFEIINKKYKGTKEQRNEKTTAYLSVNAYSHLYYLKHICK